MLATMLELAAAIIDQARQRGRVTIGGLIRLTGASRNTLKKALQKAGLSRPPLPPWHRQRNQGKPFDWPPYQEVGKTPDEIAHLRAEYASLVSMCDAKLGEVFDLMDKHNLWDAAIFGMFGGHVNITDGRRVYMRGPANADNTPLYEYTLCQCA